MFYVLPLLKAPMKLLPPLSRKLLAKKKKQPSKFIPLQEPDPDLGTGSFFVCGRSVQPVKQLLLWLTILPLLRRGYTGVLPYMAQNTTLNDLRNCIQVISACVTDWFIRP